MEHEVEKNMDNYMESTMLITVDSTPRFAPASFKGLAQVASVFRVRVQARCGAQRKSSHELCACLERLLNLVLLAIHLLRLLRISHRYLCA